MPRNSLKDQIVAAAVTTLHQRGYNATSVQDITDAAGAPKGSFYNHFKGKEALAAEALNAYWSQGLEQLALLGDEAVPAMERLRRYFRALNDFGTASHFSPGCMVGNFAAEVTDQSIPLRQKIAELFGAWTAAIESCVAHGQRDGSIRSDLPAATVAGFLLNSWEGAVLRAKVTKQGDPLSAFEELAFAGLAPRA
jgi:TetR/AcrR family transcriptional regulator, transcriptional repressor for nem operon